jgi:hypothetical protein
MNVEFLVRNEVFSQPDVLQLGEVAVFEVFDFFLELNFF